MKAFYITLILSVFLLVAGFFCPPMGIIDSSVLTAVGLLLMFATIAQVPKMIHLVNSGKSIKVQKGDFSAEVSAGEPSQRRDKGVSSCSELARVERSVTTKSKDP